MNGKKAKALRRLSNTIWAQRVGVQYRMLKKVYKRKKKEDRQWAS